MLVLVLVQVLLVEEEVLVAEDQVLVAEDLVLVEHHRCMYHLEDEVALHHSNLAASSSSWHQVPLRWNSQRLVLPDGTKPPQRWREAGQAVVDGQPVVTFASIDLADLFSASQSPQQEICGQTADVVQAC